MRLAGYVGVALVAPAAAVLAFGVLSWMFPRQEAPRLERTPPPLASAPAPAVAQGFSSEGAQGACILSIPRQMHDPGSVEFIGVTSSWPVVPAQAANTWHVRVPLRARNGLGALVAQELRCTVRRDARGWQMVGLAALE